MRSREYYSKINCKFAASHTLSCSLPPLMRPVIQTDRLVKLENAPARQGIFDYTSKAFYFRGEKPCVDFYFIL